MTDQANDSESPDGYDGDALMAAMNGASPMQVVSTSSSDDATNGGVTPNSTASAAELRGITNEESPTGKARSAEKVLIYGREHHTVCDKISSDDKSGVVDKEVGGKLQTRAMCLTIHMWNAVTHKPVYYEGQAFIIKNPNQDESQKLCTAKHNLVSEPNKKGEFEYCHAQMITHPEGFEISIKIPGTGWEATDATQVVLRDNHTWDVSLDPPLDIRSVLHNPQLAELAKSAGVYDAVGRDFLYQEGMYVAIVAYSKTGPTEEKVMNTDLTEASYPNYFGHKMETMINTGRITHVGDDHIEYDINTCGGTSGSAVVLLEEGPDFLKAIAVHAGYKPSLDKNVGFKLAGLLEDQE